MEMQGWIIRRCLTFTKNRLVNRPNKPRDPIIAKYLSDIGFNWPDDAPEESEDGESNEGDGEGEGESEDSEEGEDGDGTGLGESGGETGESEAGDFADDPPLEDAASTPQGCGNAGAEPNANMATLDTSSTSPPKPQVASPVGSATSCVVTPEPRTKAPSAVTPENVDIEVPRFTSSCFVSCNYVGSSGAPVA